MASMLAWLAWRGSRRECNSACPARPALQALPRAAPQHSTGQHRRTAQVSLAGGNTLRDVVVPRAHTKVAKASAGTILLQSSLDRTLLPLHVCPPTVSWVCDLRFIAGRRLLHMFSAQALQPQQVQENRHPSTLGMHSLHSEALLKAIG